MRCNFSDRGRIGSAADGSGEEEAHQGDDDDDGGSAVFHQHDETFIGLLMGRIIVAIRGRVGHFVMLCHSVSPIKVRNLASKYRKVVGRATPSEPVSTTYRVIRKANDP